MNKVGLVAATLVAALGLTAPAVADGWTSQVYPPPGFAPPPRVSLFSGNAPSAFYPPVPPPQRRYCPPPRYAGYDRGYDRGGHGYGYAGGQRYNGGRSLIIITR
ncbi:MAG: hypothetical protein U1E42_02485 [Rhodospirillales bacterium]